MNRKGVWDRPSQSYVQRDGRTFGQTNHPREEHCDSCGAATGHAGSGEDSNVDDEGNVYCDVCYADKQGVAEAIAKEREACARLAEEQPTFTRYAEEVLEDVVKLIRARGDA